MATTEVSELFVPYVTSEEIYAVSIILPLLGIIFVLLRFYARILQKTPTGIDDWLLLPALVCIPYSRASDATSDSSLRYYLGFGHRHGITLIIGVHGKAIAYPAPYDGDLTPEEKMTYLDPIIELSGKIQSAFVVLMVLAFGIIKLSITLYYRRIFVGIKGTLFDWITKVATVIVVLWTIACLVSSIFSCGAHFSANWGTVEDVVKYCGAMTNITNAFVVSDLITDVMILCLPLPVIWKIQMTTTRKLIVTGILATGAVSIVASIIKVIISFEIINGGPNINVDPELTASTILYWSMIEGGIAVIAACLPTLRVLISKASLSSIIRSVRSALSLGSTYTQKQSKQFPPRFGESYATVRSASPSSSTSPAPTVVEEKRGSIDSLITGNVDGMEAKGHSIQVTRQFSQHASMV